jgi:integrase
VTERLIAGDRWQGAAWDDLVFCTIIGTPLDPSNVLKQYRDLLRVAGMDTKRRVHDLRHTAGSMLARLGATPREAQAILGHANITTTLAIYTHGSTDDVRMAMTRDGSGLANVRDMKTDIGSEV